MVRDTLMLVDRELLTGTIMMLLSEERSDFPEEIHRRDAELIVKELEYPSI